MLLSELYAIKGSNLPHTQKKKDNIRVPNLRWGRNHHVKDHKA